MLNLNSNSFSQRLIRWSVCVALATCCSVSTAQQVSDGPIAAHQPPPAAMPSEIAGLEVDENLGGFLPLDTTFTDADGKVVRLGDYFNGSKPTILAMVYYDCPIVCDVLMEKQSECFNNLDLKIGKDYQVLWFSFDPTEGPDLAKQRQMLFHSGYIKAETESDQKALETGWKLHTSSPAAAATMAKALGFKYRRLDDGEYSHPVATFVISPSGKITRYIHGFGFDPRDLKLSLIESSEGKLRASIGDRLMAFCYMFDSSKGKYTLQVFRLMRVAGLVTTLLVGTGIGLLLARERSRRRHSGNFKRSKGNGDKAVVQGDKAVVQVVTTPTGLMS